MLDMEPLRKAVEARGGIYRMVDDIRGPQVRAYHRWLQAGRIGERSADNFCIKILGLQPELVWGPEFFG